MLLYHFVCAFLIPFSACLFAYFDKPSKRALQVRGTDDKNLELDENSKKANESAFLQEFPGYFFNSTVWGITYTIVGNREQNWLVIYLVQMIFSICILKIHANKNSSKGKKIFFYSIAMIFSIFTICSRILGFPKLIENILK